MARAESKLRPTGARRRSDDTPVKSAPISRFRRWVNRILGTLVLGVFGGSVWMGSAALIARPVEKLTIIGEVAHVDVVALQAKLAPRLAGGFLATDLQAVRDELEASSWIYRVNTRRRWPAEIEIQLIEQRPLARWGQTGYLNHEGQYFVAEPIKEFDHLPLLHGPAGSEATLMRQYQTFAERLEAQDLGVNQLHQDELGQITLTLDNGLVLKLGAQSALQRLGRFQRLWDETLPTRSVATIDLRYEFGAAVAFAEQGLAMKTAQKGGEG